ncbi:MAG TPA: hypothetical protein VFA19_13635 [Gaiellaceae bacterium]|nr:hypothetical protein [Gaiellaceae bacterium]HZU20440.1 hypothetical protein [Gaiellaceae bacterium]
MSVFVVLSTFLASGVEWVEALTIVLAVAVVRGWRPALGGAGAAAVALLAIVAGFGAAVSAVPLAWAQGVIGALLLAFGLRWLRKAVLRASGRKALHDEAKEFAETTESLRARREARAAFATSFTGVLLEGVEVVFIVVALGGVANTTAAAAGACAALALVVAVGFAARRPLTRVPENAMKFAVGVMLTSFGAFFVGEALDVPWWHGDVSLLLIVLGLAGVSVAAARAMRGPRVAA